MFFPKDNRPQPAVLTKQLSTEYVTIAERMREAGYKSAFLGKWHIASSVGKGGRVAPELSPTGQGFDINIGGTSYGGPPSFFSPYRNGELKDGPEGEYLPDRLVDETINFIGKNKSKPWMTHLWFYTVHWPMQAPEPLLKKYANRKGPGLNDTRYGAMIEAMDAAIGRLLKALDEMGESEETLLIFTSDNGGASYVGLPDLNKPYRGWKITFFEGGIHTPYFIRWPAKIDAGSQYKSAVAHVDIFSTALAAAGVEPPSDRIINGVNILDYALQQPQRALSRPIFWRTGGYKVVLHDGWKLQLQEQNGKNWLFNLNEDPTEQVNLSQREEYGQKLAALRETLYQLDSQMVEPLWPALIESPIAVDYTIDKLPDAAYETVIWSN